MSKCNLSIGFLGKYKPAHWERDSLEECRDAALRDVQDEHLVKKIHEVYTSITTPPLSVSSISIQGYAPFPYGVSLRKRPHDPFLDKVTADFPEFPGINYRKEQ